MEAKAPIKKFPSYLKLITYCLVTAITALFTLLLGYLLVVLIFGPDALKQMSNLDNLTDPLSLSLSKFMQIVSQLGLFVFPPLLFAMMANRNAFDYLTLNRRPKAFSFLLSILVLFAATPFINWTVEMNGMMHLPAFLSDVEKWMRSSEDLTAKVTQAYLNVNTTQGLVLNIFMIGVLPAIGEEFVFRGVLIRLFKEWLKNCHVAVILSAIIFSAIHFQFYGFLPRFLLAVLFGYLFIWTKSLWVPIVAHFINNTTTVIIAYCTNKGKAPSPMDTFGTAEGEWVWILISLIFVLLMLTLIYKREQATNDCLIEPKQNP
jgi:membrane protease YdiL (CAAX protease family)